MPEVVLGSDFHVLGSEGVPECQYTGSAYVLAYASCNVSQIKRDAFLVFIATLTLPAGLVMVHNSIVCQCMWALYNESSTMIQPGGTNQGDGWISGNTSFAAPSTTVYKDSSYGEPLDTGETLPADTLRIFLATVSAEGTVLRLVNCTASPSVQHTTKYPILTDSCPVGVLDFQAHDVLTPNTVRFSTKRFKFVGTTEVHIFCMVTRCASADGECGACGGRRLAGKDAAGPVPESAASLHIGGGDENTIVLPAPLPDDLRWELGWTGSEETLPSRNVLRFNVTIYGLMESDPTKFVETVAEVAAQWLALPRQALHPFGMYMLTQRGQGRRVPASSWVEAVVVELLVSAAATSLADVSKVASLVQEASTSRQEELTRALAIELGAVLGTPLGGLQTAVQVGDGQAPTLALAHPPVAEAEADPAWLGAVIGTVAGAAACCGFVLLLAKVQHATGERNRLCHGASPAGERGLDSTASERQFAKAEVITHGERSEGIPAGQVLGAESPCGI